MAKRETRVTTIELDALDDQRIELIQNHLRPEVGLIPKRAAITWALKVACEKIEETASHVV